MKDEIQMLSDKPYIAPLKRVMIDQMFKSILRGFRNFYKRLFQVFQQTRKDSNNDENKNKKQVFIEFMKDLGLFKFLNE